MLFELSAFLVIALTWKENEVQRYKQIDTDKYAYLIVLCMAFLINSPILGNV
jgi:hypothetical protein